MHLFRSEGKKMPEIEYHVGLNPEQIMDGTLEYFKSKGFTTVHLIARTTSLYSSELKKIREYGMNAILDVEQIIWAGGSIQLPIQSFERALRSWADADWEVIASEGGREGDNDYFQKLHLKFAWYNCDQCGIFHIRDHIHPNTSLVSWECYYPEEIKWIQAGAFEAAELKKQQGILAGVWPNNNQVRANSLNAIGSPTAQDGTYRALLDWSYQKGVNFSHFHTWFGLGPTLNDYINWGFEKIVAELQKYYPPKSHVKTLDDVLGVVKYHPDDSEFRENGMVVIFGGKKYYTEDKVNWKQFIG